jgi:DNA-binding transcriptional LysR family regulator
MDLNGIELSHLRYFLAVAEELHFGRAALRLHIAQPPLTRHIQILESRLGCRLFERTSRSTRLTPAGELLRDRARAILAETNLTFQTIRRAATGEEGQLTVATAPSLMLGGLPKIIRAFRRKFPHVDFRLHEMATSAILQSITTGTADLGFVRGRDKDPHVAAHLTWPDPLVAIVPNDFPKGPVSLSQLRAHPFVFFPRHIGPSLYDEVMAVCRRAGFTPAIAQEARQWSSIISLVSAGMGVSLAPQSIQSLLPKAARYVPIPKATTTVRIIGRKTGAANPAIENFLQICRTATPTLPQPSISVR